MNPNYGSGPTIMTNPIAEGLEEVTMADLLEMQFPSINEPIFIKPEIYPLDWDLITSFEDIKKLFSLLIVAEIDINELPELEPYVRKDK
jgi:hypothetical protein